MKTHARLSEIDVKIDLRNNLRKLKEEKTYDEFLRELISIYQDKKNSGANLSRHAKKNIQGGQSKEVYLDS